MPTDANEPDPAPTPMSEPAPHAPVRLFSSDLDGTLLGSGARWDVQMTKVAIDGSELLVCAVGGSAEARKKQIARGAAGALRILAA